MLATRHVAGLAHTAQVPAADLTQLLSTLFHFEPGSVIDVYGSIDNCAAALHEIRQLLEFPGAPENRETLRYLFGAMYLEKKLSVDNGLSQVLRSRLQHAALQNNHFTDNIEQLVASVAAIYQDTLSTLPQRIHVTGNYQHLQDDRVAHRIRTLLLAAVRSLHLWRQCGGAKWRLLLQRSRYLETTIALQELSSIQTRD